MGRWINREYLPLDLHKSQDILKDLVKTSKSDNTYKQYNTYFKAYSAWCRKYDFNPLPSSDYHVSLFLASLKYSCPSASKINAIVYGISWAHKIAGFSDPCDSDLVLFAKNGLIRANSKPPVQKCAISIEDMKKIVQHFGKSDSLLDLRFVTMCLVCFSGFLRFSELVSLKRCDITFFEDCAKINIVESKTDQLCKGKQVTICKTNSDLCPVFYLQKYILVANIQDISREFLFRNIKHCKKMNTDILVGSKQMSYSRAREILHDKLREIGLDPNVYGLHSFRSGGATAAANSGVSDRLLKKHGRWKTDNAKDRYVRDSDETQKIVSSHLGL